jgi:hypothetical protein
MIARPKRTERLPPLQGEGGGEVGRRSTCGSFLTDPHPIALRSTSPLQGEVQAALPS